MSRPIPKLSKPFKTAFFALLAAFCLSGCETYRDAKESVFGPSGAPPPCPNISVLRDASEITRYQPGDGRDLTDVLYQGRINDVLISCNYIHSGKVYTEVDTTLQLVFDAERGPADRDHQADFQYFIAIDQFFPQPSGRQEFSTRIAFPGNRTKLTAIDPEVTIKIPFASPGETGANYDIIIGFVLTQAEMQENRQRRQQP